MGPSLSQMCPARVKPIVSSWKAVTDPVIMQSCVQSDLSSLCASGPCKLPHVPLVPSARTNMLHSSSRSTKTRLARLQDPLLGYTTEELRNMDYEDLGKLKVSFGKTKKGMSFLEAVESDPGWTKWCTDHLTGTGKAEHEAFLIFVEKYVRQREAAEQMLLKDGTAPDPKSKPRHQKKKAPQHGHPRDPWAMIECQEPSGNGDLHLQVNALQGRMEQMEHALQRVLEPCSIYKF